MDCNQKFCLKWNNFQNSVTSVFDNLRQDEELVDITLCCEGKKIKAHRMMLSACSPYFRDLLKENPCQHPVFFLKDTLYPDLAAVVEFVYKGEVNVTQSQLGSFLKTAEMLQVRGLAGEDEGAPPQPQPPRSSAAPPPTFRPSPPAVPSPPSPAAWQSPARSRPPPPAAPPEPAVKRRRLSTGGSPEQEPLPAEPQAGEAAAKSEISVKLEQEDGDTDAGLEAAFGVGSAAAAAYEAAPFEVGGGGAQDVAGFLSRVAEQGGGGDMALQQTPGPSEEGAPQAATAAAGAAGWRCAECNRTYRHLFSYQSHLKVHRGATTCRLCGRVFARVFLLNAHMESSHGIRRRRYNVQAPSSQPVSSAGVSAGKAREWVPPGGRS